VTEAGKLHRRFGAEARYVELVMAFEEEFGCENPMMPPRRSHRRCRKFLEKNARARVFLTTLAARVKLHMVRPVVRSPAGGAGEVGRDVR